MDANTEPLDDESQHDGLTLARYAEIAAHVQHFPRRQTEEVLVRLGSTTAAWTSAASAWTNALLEESEADGTERAKVYGTVFAKTRARLRLENPDIATLGPLVVEAAVVPAPSTVAAPAAEMAPTPSPHVHEPEPPPLFSATASVSPWVRPAMPSLTIGERAIAAPPSFMAPYVAAPEIEWMPEAMRRFTSVDTTQEGGSAPSAPVLPFAADAGARAAALENALAEAVRIQGPPPNPAADEDAGSTLALTGLHARMAAAGLPFPSARPPTTVEPHVPPPRPAAARGPDGTMALSGLGALVRAAELPVASASAVSQRPTDALSMERFASVCVELSLEPEHRAETLWRYELTEERWSAVEREWQARFAREPPARTAWEHACTAYKTWLTTYRK